MKTAAENKVEVKPLLNKLESRLVFTKCKPFNLDIPTRKFIFGESNLFPTKDSSFNSIIIFSRRLNEDRKRKGIPYICASF